MKHVTIAVLSLVFTLPLLAGCGDSTVEHRETKSTNPITGTRTTEEQTVHQRSDGSTYTDTQTHTSN